MKAYLIPGGGARILYTVFAMELAYEMGKFDPSKDNFPLIGDSAGGLVAYLLAIGKNPSEIAEVFLKLDLAAILTPWYKRWIPWDKQIITSVTNPISLEPFMHWIDDNFPCPDVRLLERLVISAWHDEYNTAVLPCVKRPDWTDDIDGDDIFWQEGAYALYSPGYWLTCGMTLPVLEAPFHHFWWIDGGVGEHPMISILPRDTELWYFGLSPELLTPRHPVIKAFVEKSSTAQKVLDKVPLLNKLLNPNSTSLKGTLERSFRIYSIKAKKYQDSLLAQFPKVINLDTGLMEIGTTAFNMSEKDKLNVRYEARKAAMKVVKQLP